MRKINTYKRLDDLYLNWYDGYTHFAAVVGGPGLAKSWTYERLLKDTDYTLLTERTTALTIYQKVYDFPDRRIVFDDVGDLLRNPTSLELLKALCNTRPLRTVHWNTNTTLLKGRRNEFCTKAPVLVVCNRTLLDNDDVRAILDRANAVEFCPSKKEIISKMRTYAEDQEIVDFLEQMPGCVSLRTYELARDLKLAPRGDWRQEVMDECGVEPHIQTLIQILQTESPENWLKVYIAYTGRSRRDYYNHLPLARELATAAVGNREHFCTTQAQTNEGGL